MCAGAYDREKFWFQGGFIRKTIFNEDMIFAGKAILEDDYAVAYVASARVIHSHNYTCMQQFRRNFDLAVSQADHPEIFSKVSSESEGIRLVKQTARFLAGQHKPWLIPGIGCQKRIQIHGATGWENAIGFCPAPCGSDAA